MLRSIRIINFISSASNSFLIKNESKVNQRVKSNLLWQRMISCTNWLNEFETEAKKPRKKTEKEEKITLIYPNESMTVTILEDAAKLAKRRNLQLINVTERHPNVGRKVYKLLNATKLNEIIDENVKNPEESKDKQKFKSTKLFTMKAVISEHDLNTKITNMNKVLKKNHLVKILLTHPSGGQENVVKIIKNKIEGKVSKEETKKGATVLIFLPLFHVPSNSLETDSGTNLS